MIRIICKSVQEVHIPALRVRREPRLSNNRGEEGTATSGIKVLSWEAVSVTLSTWYWVAATAGTPVCCSTSKAARRVFSTSFVLFVFWPPFQIRTAAIMPHRNEAGMSVPSRNQWSSWIFKLNWPYPWSMPASEATQVNGKCKSDPTFSYLKAIHTPHAGA